MEPLTKDVFVGYLRNALHYLYDPVHLRHSILIKLFVGVDTEFDPATTLQQILISAIHGLKPDEDEFPQSNAWRIYDLLNLQFVRQYSRNMVATQLGVSERQLRREQRLALEGLAQYIFKHHIIRTMEDPEKVEELVPSEDLAASDAFNAELGWLKNTEFEQHNSLNEVLNTVYKLIQPLSVQWNAPLQIEIEPGAEDFPVAQLVIRNILLTILSVMIPQSGHKPMKIAAGRQKSEIEIRVTCCDANQHPHPFSEKENTSIDTARRLAALNGAHLAITRQSEGLTVTLILPAPQQIPVLVIDDNADWLDLLKRYAVGSRYRVIVTREPAAGCLLAEKLQPAVIFLDVMMPDIDGWQVISELRHERSTSHIPIIVCSILPVEGLALSLGVNAFLQKPVTQSQFLIALDQQVGIKSS